MAIDLDGPNSAINVNTIETHSGSTLTIGKSGDTVSLGSGASASGFSKDGAIAWDSSIKSANTSITTGTGFFVDTTSAAITITLPGSPSVGDIVGIKDYAGTFGTNNLTIARNGSNIQGNANDSAITTNRASVVLVYADATRGWLYTVESNVADLEAPGFVAATGGTITTDGDYKIHTFTSSGTFTVTDAGSPTTSNSVDYLVVAGGGGSGSYFGAAGGAGGFRYSATTFTSPASSPAHPLRSTSAIPVSVQAYPITVGGGGSAAPQSPGTQGSSSTFSTITSAGGGFGGGGTPGPSIYPGGNGGSGGGAGGENGPSGTAGSGNTPSVSPPQGQNGNTGKGGAGGGAVQAGNPFPGAGGNGAGVPSAFGTSGESSGGFYYFAGGGGGQDGTSSAQPGGLGGGGNSYYVDSGATNDATPNTGGGGGGDGGDGGSGIVIIRYKFQ